MHYSELWPAIHYNGTMTAKKEENEMNFIEVEVDPKINEFMTTCHYRYIYG